MTVCIVNLLKLIFYPTRSILRTTVHFIHSFEYNIEQITNQYFLPNLSRFSLRE